MKKVDKKKNPGLAKLPTAVRNKMSNRRYNTQTRMKFLKGGQAKLDANKDGKITAEDFAMLRGKKKTTKKKKPGMMMMAMKGKK